MAEWFRTIALIAEYSDTLTHADFGSGGTVNWWAGRAFVHYLDTINYNHSVHWSLPTPPIADKKIIKGLNC